MSDIIKGYKINISNVTGDIVITARPIENSDGTSYTITRNLTNCTSSNISNSISKGSSYSTIITANSEYELMDITVTMGGIDITSTAVNPIIEDSEDTNMIPKMTYGRGINQTTAVIESNPKCWATVNPVTVIVGQTYTISCDAPWVWVYGFDESDNYTSQLVLGTNEVPQNFTFTADTTKIRFGCYDPKKQLTYCTLTKQDLD